MKRQPVRSERASVREGGKVLVLGNGGSAADAQHFAAEMVNRFLMERKALPALIVAAIFSFGAEYIFTNVFVVDLPT